MTSKSKLELLLEKYLCLEKGSLDILPLQVFKKVLIERGIVKISDIEQKLEYILKRRNRLTILAMFLLFFFFGLALFLAFEKYYLAAAVSGALVGSFFAPILYDLYSDPIDKELSETIKKFNGVKEVLNKFGNELRDVWVKRGWIPRYRIDMFISQLADCGVPKEVAAEVARQVVIYGKLCVVSDVCLSVVSCC